MRYRDHRKHLVTCIWPPTSAGVMPGALSRPGGCGVDQASSQGIQAVFFSLAPLCKISTNGKVPRYGFLLVVGNRLSPFRDPLLVTTLGSF